MLKKTLLMCMALSVSATVGYCVPVTVFTNYQGGNSGGQAIGTDMALAMSFTPTSNAFLTSAELYLFSGGAAASNMDIFLMSDSGGNPGSVLESLGTIALSSSTPSLFTATASGTTLLTSGTTYWIAAAFSSGSVAAGWASGGSPFTAERFSSANGINGPWQPNSNALQFIVNGETASRTAAVPEPATLGLTAAALGSLLYVKKRRTA